MSSLTIEAGLSGATNTAITQTTFLSKIKRGCPTTTPHMDPYPGTGALRRFLSAKQSFHQSSKTNQNKNTKFFQEKQSSD